jgi:hypothetical protein
MISVFLDRDEWRMQNTLLAQTAVKILCVQQRQQTRLLADYLQVLLSTVRSASISDAVLDSLTNTVTGLRPILASTSKQPHAQDNQLLLACFVLQLMLCTLTAPLQQTSGFHGSPDFNAERSSQTQMSSRQSPSAMSTSLVQHVMQWLHMLEAQSPTELRMLLEELASPHSDSKVPAVEDAAFLDLAEVEVCLHGLS